MSSVAGFEAAAAGPTLLPTANIGLNYASELENIKTFLQTYVSQPRQPRIPQDDDGDDEDDRQEDEDAESDDDSELEDGLDAMRMGGEERAPREKAKYMRLLVSSRTTEIQAANCSPFRVAFFADTRGQPKDVGCSD